MFCMLLLTAILCGCTTQKESKSLDLEAEKQKIQTEQTEGREEGKEGQEIGEMELEYATQFSVKYYEEGYAEILVADGNSYICVPEGKEEKSFDVPNPVYIHMPCDNIYLAASSAMDLFRELDGLSNIKACSTREEDYSMEEIQKLIREDVITYVGKYSAPDYERLLQNGTDLAIESTMIYHSPKIKEELTQLGIPVFVERSSYEEQPLGRLEWIKLYGLLLGKEEMANQIFDTQIGYVNDIIQKQEEVVQKGEKPQVVFFYISSNGYVNVRKPGDYVSKMIEIAGGEYALESLKIEEENALSTVNISWEDFYMYAKDADILIYNGTIDGGLPSVDALVSENEMFEEFRAVESGQVYCAMNNMYQETSQIGNIIVELTDVVNAKNDAAFQFEGKYIKKLD